MTTQLEALLVIARDTLRTGIMPAVFGDARFKTAMLANALAIVQRSIAEGGKSESAESAALAALCPDVAEEGTARRTKLVADIRRGAFDGRGDELVATLLAPRVRARLAVSQPDYRRIIPRT